MFFRGMYLVSLQGMCIHSFISGYVFSFRVFYIWVCGFICTWVCSFICTWVCSYIHGYLVSHLGRTCAVFANRLKLFLYIHRWTAPSPTEISRAQEVPRMHLLLTVRTPPPTFLKLKLLKKPWRRGAVLIASD
jgi:hypothetical protein